jgi:hypothetical protein
VHISATQNKEIEEDADHLTDYIMYGLDSARPMGMKEMRPIIITIARIVHISSLYIAEMFPDIVFAAFLMFKLSSPGFVRSIE